MRILETKKYDATNGPGIRYSIWIAGCHFHCEGCWNNATWDFNQGTLYKDIKDKIFREIENNKHISGISILGGEPLSTYIRKGDKDIVDLCRNLKIKGYNIWLWTGYNLEDIPQEILQYLDTVITGRFEKDKRDLNLQYMGSSNQKINYLNEDKGKV